MAHPAVTRSLRKQSPHSKHTPGTLLGFNYRRPFDGLWALFSSVRLCIVLISILIGMGLVGAIISQAPAEVVSSPQDYAAWVAANAAPQYHQFTNLMDWMQLFILFRSWYFKLLIVLLATNILVGGMINRAPGIWQKFRHPQLKRNDGFYVNSPVRVGLTVGADDATTEDTAASMRGFFQRRGYRVETAPPSNGEATYLFAHRHTWSALSTFVFHSCLIATMLCAVLTGWGGFGRNSMAQRILPAPIYKYFQGLAGFSYDQPMPNGDQGVVYPMGTPHNIIYRAQQFVMTVDPQRMEPTDFYTDLQVFQDGKLVAEKRIRVNDPLTYQGVTFHQASFMMYTNVTLRDNQGNVIFSGSVPLTDHRVSTPDPNTGNVAQVNNAEDVPIPNYDETMNLGAALLPSGGWLVGIKAFDGNGKQVLQGAGVFGAACVSPDGQQFVAPGQYGCVLSNGWSLQINDVRRGTVLLVTKDAGSPLLWPILALLVLSVWVTFSFPPRRFWLRIAGNQVQMAALKEHTVNHQRDLDAFAQALGNRPLHSTPPPEETAKATPGKSTMTNAKSMPAKKAKEKQPAAV
jgi:cytochrome c biogenesis protein